MKTKKGKKLWTRIRLAMNQNSTAVAFVILWVAAGIGVFLRVGGLPLRDAVLAATCVSKSSVSWGSIYQSFTEVAVFGAVASFVVGNVTRKYRPEATARAIAADARDHVVVVGFSHLGQRVAELAAHAGSPVVVVEQDAEKVAALVHEEEPLVIGNARERAVLEAAGVDAAKVVVLATDDLETAAVACRLVRDMNDSCELVVRCPDDDVGAVLAKTYRARSLSTSRLAADFIRSQAVKARAKNVLVLGSNNLALRVMEALREKRITVSESASAADVDLVVICDDDLGKNLLTVDRIRDVNKRVKIICRVFHDDAAEVLTREPFSCTVLSTSRHAAESLVRSGVFREVGMVEVPSWTTNASWSSSA